MHRGVDLLVILGSGRFDDRLPCRDNATTAGLLPNGLASAAEVPGVASSHDRQNIAAAVRASSTNEVSKNRVFQMQFKLWHCSESGILNDR